jgi:zinc/manganese transport system substrate-binding protein
MLKPLLAIALGFATVPTAAMASPVKAVASFSILGDIVKQIGGDDVQVTTIVGPNADTHVYEPKPSDAVELAGADVFVVNGLGFEGWMDRLIQSTGYKGPVAVATKGVATHTMDEDGQTVTDPHAWQSAANVATYYVPNIVTALCTADPADCAVFQANGADYTTKLNALDQQVKDEISAIPKAQRKVITTHDAFGYFGLEYGVTFLAPEGISTDSEPSAAAVASLIQQIRQENVTALFLENMTDTRLIKQIADETGVKAGGVLYADALSEPDQDAGTYLDMFEHNVSLLIPAMMDK